MRHMLAKTYHLPCVYFSCIVALLSVRILRCLNINLSEYLIGCGLSVYFALQFLKKPELIFSCNKSISLIVVQYRSEISELCIRSLYAHTHMAICVYTHGNTRIRV